jgi:arylsulfatase A-like enzyme
VNPHDVMYFDTDPDGGTQRSEIFPIFPAPDAEPYTDELAVELPASFDDDLAAQPEGVQAYAHLCDVTYGEVPKDRTDLWLRHVNYYVNCIRDVDRHLGTVLDALEASGQAENTIVVYTSDHGELAGAHGLRQKGGVAYKETVNVPFVVAHPDGPKGVETDAVGSHLDLAPTMLALAGLGEQERRERYPDLHGEDLSSLILDPQSNAPRGSPSAPGKGALYTYDMLSTIDIDWLARVAQATLDMGDAEVEQADEENEADRGPVRKALETMHGVLQPDFSLRHNLRGVFDGRYKLVRYFALDGYNTPADIAELRENNNVALYDLQTDPQERDNLANADHPHYDEQLLASLNAKLNALVRTEIGTDKALVKRPMLTIIGSTISEKLRARF